MKIYLFYRKHNSDTFGNNRYIVDLFNHENGNLFDSYHLLKRTMKDNNIGNMEESGALTVHNNGLIHLKEVLEEDNNVQLIHLFN